MTKRRSPIDPAVASLVTEGTQRQARRRKTRAEQIKAKKDAARSRVTYDLPEVLQSAVAQVAEREGLSASAVVTLLLADGIRRWREESISFYGLKRPSRSPLYEFVVDEQVVVRLLQGNEKLENRE